MSFAIQLDDRALAFAQEGRVIASAPSAVFRGGEGTVMGAPAWHALRRQPALTTTRHLSELARNRPGAGQAAALFAAELRQRLNDHREIASPEGMWIATSALFEATGLGVVLGIVQELQLRINGFIDAAVASVAAVGLDHASVVLEPGLHHIAAVGVEGGTRARRRTAAISDRGGVIELYEAWLDLISAAMVKRTRFDPLHDAATEQYLFDSLPRMASEAAATGGSSAAVTAGSEQIEVPLSRDQLGSAVQPIAREMLRLVHEVRPAGAEVSVLAPRSFAHLPGVREALESLSGCELVTFEDGFAAAATSLLPLQETTPGDSVRLLRRAPARRYAELAALLSVEPLGAERARAPDASHVLYAGRAFPLDASGIVVGRSPQQMGVSASPREISDVAASVMRPAASAATTIVLPEGLAGVSRRHCSFVRNGNETILVDHSSYGTFVNGERVLERVRVQAGDRVRIGDPGVELTLIAVGADNGTPA